MANQLAAHQADIDATQTVSSAPLTMTAPETPGGDPQASAWQEAMHAWLASKQSRSGSRHTVRAYQNDWLQFFQFARKAPWQVTSRDATAWLQQLQATGAGESSINRKLASLSSFYQFVIDQFTVVGRDRRQRSLYCDAQGNARPNPFRKPERPKTEQYSHSQPIDVAVVRKVLKQLNQTTLLGSRDYALLVAYIYTGRRSSEIANLRWRNVEADPTQGRYYYEWSSGRGGKCHRDELPPPVYHAIVNFLTVNGRLETIHADDFIFQPVFGERTVRLPNVHEVPEANRPISGSMINRIVKRHFVAAGIPAEAIHTHTLRHTAAHLRHQNGAGQDALAISRLLNHSRVAITEIYLSKMQQPIDSGWSAVEELLAA